MTDHPGPINLYFAERHARIALERIEEDHKQLRALGGEPTNADGHTRHVVYRLQKELKLIAKMLGKPDWRIRLRRGKYRK
jgi:hypothetical protein